jgi:hypothetical protein
MKIQHRGWNFELPSLVWHRHSWDGRVISSTLRWYFIPPQGWLHPTATECEQKKYVTLKFPRTLVGIEPGTFRLVAQCHKLLGHRSHKKLVYLRTYGNGYTGSEVFARYRLYWRTFFARIKPLCNFIHLLLLMMMMLLLLLLCTRCH